MINFESGNRVFGGPRKGINGKVEGKIMENLPKDLEEIYSISFKVIINGDTSGMYKLDPKLLVH
jgi:hypothetical protein